MWHGVYPAVTSKFTFDDNLDFAEMERCFSILMDAGCDGLITCGSLGEGSMLTSSERLDVLKCAKSVAGERPVLMTIGEATTKQACSMAELAATAGADGLMVIPSTMYHTDHRETVTNMREIARATDLPIMIYSNRIAYRVDVSIEILRELAIDDKFVAIKESSDDIRRTTDIINEFGDRFEVLTGVDNLAFEALCAGAVGWVAGLVLAFPRETVAIYRLIKSGEYDRAREIYRWFRPLLDLDVSRYLVQNIKLAEVLSFNSNDRVRAPRLPLAGEHRDRVQKIILDAIKLRPEI